GGAGVARAQGPGGGVPELVAGAGDQADRQESQRRHDAAPPVAQGHRHDLGREAEEGGARAQPAAAPPPARGGGMKRTAPKGRHATAPTAPPPRYWLASRVRSCWISACMGKR